MTPSQPLVAISGAGPAGLTLACLLERARITYTVFERDELAAWAHKHASSGTLDIRKDSGQAALREAGLLEKFQSLARHDVPVRIADTTGHVCADIPGDGNSDKPEIDRKDLGRLLLASVPKARIRWGCKVEHVQRDSHGSVLVLCADGHVESGYRLVVGADGAWSKVRKLVSQRLLRNERGESSCLSFSAAFLADYSPTANIVRTRVLGNSFLHHVHQAQRSNLQLSGFPGREWELSSHEQAAADIPALSVGCFLPPLRGLEALPGLGLGVWHSPRCICSVGVPAARRVQGMDSTIDRAHPIRRPWFSTLAVVFFTQIISSPPLSGAERKTTQSPLLPLKGFIIFRVPAGEGVNNALCDSVELARQIVTHGIEYLDAAVAEYEKMFPRALAACAKGE